MAAQPGNQVIMIDSEVVIALVGDVAAKHGGGGSSKGGSSKAACMGRALSLAAKLAENAEVEGCRAVPSGELLPIVSSTLALNWSLAAVVIPSCTVLASLAKARSDGEFGAPKVKAKPCILQP